MIERKDLEIKYLSKENDQFYVEKKIRWCFKKYAETKQVEF